MIIISAKHTKQKILDAALIEFTDKGYKHASTNNIVKKAGVGKGMLYYYFNNKKELYRYLVDMGIEAVNVSLEKEQPFIPTDFLERCRNLSKLKMDRYIRDPLLFNFFGNSYLNDCNVPELSDIIQKEIDLSSKMHDDFYRDLDISAFRKDIASDELIKIIKWALDGYETDLVNRLKGEDLSKADLTPLWEEADKFVANLKKIFYG